MDPKVTRFRAYQLGCPGSSFSMFVDGHFTLLEARLTEVNNITLSDEMARCGVNVIDTLHITSWDQDHCQAGELEILLDSFQPALIECPGYDPQTKNGQKCRELISSYRTARSSSNRPVDVRDITPKFISSLQNAQILAFQDVFYNPKHIDDECANNNSTVTFFRKGSFNVLSLGDVENSLISARLRRSKFLRRETDVMILAHHGADNGFTTNTFLKHLSPTLAICSSNYDNVYDHPRDEIRELLDKNGVRLMTTKTGDVLVKSIGKHTGSFRAINFKAGSTEISSHQDFSSKKARLLSFNRDTIRALYRKNTPYPRKGPRIR